MSGWGGHQNLLKGNRPLDTQPLGSVCPWAVAFVPLFLSYCLPGPFPGPSPPSASGTLVWFLVTDSSSPLRRYLENYLANLFAGAWEPQPEGPLPLDIPQASPQQVNCLCALARDPHLLCGFSVNQYWGCDLGG